MLCCCSALALLVEILTEPAQKDVVNALTVLANVASRFESHSLVSACILQYKVCFVCIYLCSLYVCIVDVLVYCSVVKFIEYFL